MKKTLESKINLIVIIVLCAFIVFIVCHGMLVKANGQGEFSDLQVYATPDMALAVTVPIPPDATEPASTTEPTTEATTVEETEETSQTTEATTEATTEPTTEEETVQWATVMTMETKASLQEQWDNGYIVAIDYPDKTYRTFHIELTEEDRDILERLCMGEFGTGGFIGAALIAQCVKDAMCFDGYKTVEEVRVNCKYDASLDTPPSQEVKNAVSYIFDYDQAAVQHRIMYMYNPYLVQSSFHESQNYILTYGEIRFFDRWGY